MRAIFRSTSLRKRFFFWKFVKVQSGNGIKHEERPWRHPGTPPPTPAAHSVVVTWTLSLSAWATQHIVSCDRLSIQGYTANEGPSWECLGKNARHLHEGSNSALGTHHLGIPRGSPTSVHHFFLGAFSCPTVWFPISWPSKPSPPALSLPQIPLASQECETN